MNKCECECEVCECEVCECDVCDCKCECCKITKKIGGYYASIYEH